MTARRGLWISALGLVADADDVFLDARIANDTADDLSIAPDAP
jgi:hypothetical protein